MQEEKEKPPQEKAHMGISDLVAAQLPKGKKELEKRLSELYENLTRNQGGGESREVQWLRARIKQASFELNRFYTREVTWREGLLFRLFSRICGSI